MRDESVSQQHGATLPRNILKEARASVTGRVPC